MSLSSFVAELLLPLIKDVSISRSRWIQEKYKLWVPSSSTNTKIISRCKRLGSVECGVSVDIYPSGFDISLTCRHNSELKLIQRWFNSYLKPLGLATIRCRNKRSLELQTHVGRRGLTQCKSLISCECINVNAIECTTVKSVFIREFRGL